jgi:hypothetical protein
MNAPRPGRPKGEGSQAARLCRIWSDLHAGMSPEAVAKAAGPRYGVHVRSIRRDFRALRRHGLMPGKGTGCAWCPRPAINWATDAHDGATEPACAYCLPLAGGASNIDTTTEKR